MDTQSCSTCGKKKSLLECGICHGSVCKNCAEFLAEEKFELKKDLSEDLKHPVYCRSCFQQHVEGPLAEYTQLVEQAKEILIFTKSQGKETRFIRRNEDFVEVKDCKDHDLALMQMAFEAVRVGCNAVVDVDIIGKKVRNGSYQTQTFQGTGRPAQVKAGQLVKDRSIWSAPN